MIRKQLPDDLQQAANEIHADMVETALSQHEVADLLAKAEAWQRTPSSENRPTTLRCLHYTLLGEELDVSFEFNLYAGTIERGWPTTRGNKAHTAQLVKHWRQDSPTVADLIAGARDAADARFSLLGATKEIYEQVLTEKNFRGWDVLAKEFPRHDAAGDAFGLRSLADDVEERLKYLPQLTEDMERCLKDLFILGYCTAQMELSTFKLSGDGQTLAERSLTALKVADARRRGGKIRGQYQTAEAATLREKILLIAVPLRGADPSISDDDLNDAIRERIGLKVGAATVRSHIRALKREGRLQARLPRRR